MSTPIRNIVKKTLSPRIFKSPRVLNTPNSSLLSEVTSPCKINTLISNTNKYHHRIKFDQEDLDLCHGDKFDDFAIRKPKKKQENEDFSYLKIPKAKDIPSINTPERDTFLKCDFMKFNLNVFGKGSFGTVVQATYKGKDVAMKIIRNQNYQKSVLLESNALNLSHPNILPVLLITNNAEAEHQLIIMPECVAEDMQKVLNEKDTNIPFQIYVTWVIQICSALEYCHSKKILHLDVKPKNILMQNNKCLLCDFGNSLDLNSDVQKQNYLRKLLDGNGGSTVIYSAPEILHGKKLPTNSADVYALGITMYQIQTRCRPYEHIQDMHSILYQVVKHNLRPKIPEELTSECECAARFLLFYKNCWHDDPTQRISIVSLRDSLQKIMFEHSLHI